MVNETYSFLYPQSGQAVAFWNIRGEFEMKKRQFAFQLGKLVNCSTTDSTELVECLRLVDAMVLEQTVAMVTDECLLN